RARKSARNGSNSRPPVSCRAPQACATWLLQSACQLGQAGRDLGPPDAVAKGCTKKPSQNPLLNSPQKKHLALCSCEAGGTQAMRRAVIYLRVSTLDQTTANQERELRETADRMGCEIVKVYKDHGISGTRGRDKRPAFDKLCRDAARREFDMVMAWSVDRLGRSLQDLVGFLSELHALKIDLFLRQQGLDTTTPAGKAMFQMMGVFAEFERAMIQERVRAGLARA